MSFPKKKIKIVPKAVNNSIQGSANSSINGNGNHHNTFITNQYITIIPKEPIVFDVPIFLAEYCTKINSKDSKESNHNKDYCESLEDFHKYYTDVCPNNKTCLSKRMFMRDLELFGVVIRPNSSKKNFVYGWLPKKEIQHTNNRIFNAIYRNSKANMASNIIVDLCKEKNMPNIESWAKMIEHARINNFEHILDSFIAETDKIRSKSTEWNKFFTGVFDDYSKVKFLLEQNETKQKMEREKFIRWAIVVYMTTKKFALIIIDEKLAKSEFSKEDIVLIRREILGYIQEADATFIDIKKEVTFRNEESKKAK